MTQADINRQVAQATGEDVRTIAQRGFSMVEDHVVDREPLVVDWDHVQAQRSVRVFDQPDRPRAA
jgi:hypothetical protein